MNEEQWSEYHHSKMVEKDKIIEELKIAIENLNDKEYLAKVEQYTALEAKYYKLKSETGGGQ